MKKILLVDDSLSGHHKIYMKNIIENINKNFVVVLPDVIDEISIKCSVVKYNQKKFSLLQYIRYINKIRDIAKKEEVDIIHFLSGDSFYKYFGLFFYKLKKQKIVVTFHKIPEDSLHLLSLKRICRYIDIAIVHSSYLQNVAEKMGIYNVVKVSYPSFCKKKNKVFIKKMLGIEDNEIVIGAIGGTRKSKNIGLLLDALANIDVPFRLIIAGKLEDYGEVYIREKVDKYINNVSLILKILDDEEYSNVINACDIIAIPYTRSFNGASGPLCDGVYTNAFIIGLDAGNIGKTIKDNHLGYTFKADDCESLCEVIKYAIKNEFKRDDKYYAFQSELNPKNFVQSYERIYNNLDDHT